VAKNIEDSTIWVTTATFFDMQERAGLRFLPSFCIVIQICIFFSGTGALDGRQRRLTHALRAFVWLIRRISSRKGVFRKFCTHLQIPRWYTCNFLCRSPVKKPDEGAILPKPKQPSSSRRCKCGHGVHEESMVHTINAVMMTILEGRVGFYKELQTYLRHAKATFVWFLIYASFSR